ncbi:primosomal protein N' [Streptomyces sp. NBRC 110611]|nr:primosomal protein N' [Streptomyces sp. NBRC 110611]
MAVARPAAALLPLALPLPLLPAFALLLPARLLLGLAPGLRLLPALQLRQPGLLLGGQPGQQLPRLGQLLLDGPLGRLE